MTRRRSEETEGVWRLRRGTPHPAGAPLSKADREDVTYNNPYRYKIERGCDGKVIYASELGELEIDAKKVKVAQEYQLVYSVHLDRRRKVKPGTGPERVRGPYNIYDSIPGMKKYSPIWQFNYVIVPRDYRPNMFRSEKDCLRSGYEIRRSRVFKN